ncbi:hypothetical protein DPMN_152537 [Dreissena polymorpha]|uniref:Vps52 C-terminal domain-containing protein n=1 Tax=Dreissena polymorpha TaxID=45954 RepID=A0A9D4J808_DREPO|nr:hypothetical protein DPMN_152537 [Dreissena polymorpha]
MDNASREYLFLTDFFMASTTTALDLFNTVLGKTLSIFLVGIHLGTKQKLGTIDRVYRILEQLQAEVQNFILKLAAEFPHRKEQLIFLINNYDMMLGVISYIRYSSELLVVVVWLFRAVSCSKVVQRLVVQSFVMGLFRALKVVVVLLFRGRIPRLLRAWLFRAESCIVVVVQSFVEVVQSCVLASKESESFKELLTARTHEFIDEVLTPHFGGMIMFVKDCEGCIERGQLDALKNEEMKGFNADWKRALEYINGEVMRAFTNFKNGTLILQLIQYYHRFQKVLNQGPLRQLQIRNELINIHHVMVEVKKYKPTF